MLPYSINHISPYSQTVRGEFFDEEVKKAVSDLGIAHATEHLPLGSDDAINSVACAWAAIFYEGYGEFELALEEIEKALIHYRRCDLSEDMDEFNDFESLLHFHKGAMYLYLGDYSKAEAVLSEEYDPSQNLGQTVLYRLIEQKTNIAILVHPENLKKDGCLDPARHQFPPGPKQRHYEENLEIVNEAVYIALLGDPKQAIHIYNSLHLDPIEQLIHRRQYAAIQALYGDLDVVEECFQESDDMFDLDYAALLESHLLGWLSE